MPISEAQIHEAAQKLVTDWVFPGGTCHSPDALTMARADRLGWMLVARMKELVSAGVDPRGMSIEQVLDIDPEDIELTEADVR